MSVQKPLILMEIIKLLLALSVVTARAALSFQGNIRCWKEFNNKACHVISPIRNWVE